MQAELKSLQIDREKKRSHEPSPWAVRWIIAGVCVFVLLGAARFIYAKLTAATPVDIVRVHAAAPIAGGEGNVVILNATGYIVAAPPNVISVGKPYFCPNSLRNGFFPGR